MPHHQYKINLSWTGNSGAGTKDYRSYERSHVITGENKPSIPGSSDPAFRGDAGRYNPEELLVASLSSCHMLWYLHLCAVAGIVVVDYQDHASGIMLETSDGGGYFTEVTLHPLVTITDAARIADANNIHQRAHQMCFIARSCNFPVHHQPVCHVADTALSQG